MLLYRRHNKNLADQRLGKKTKKQRTKSKGIKMKNEYVKGEKIRLYKAAGSGRWRKYTSAISADEFDLFLYACSKRLMTKGNDAPRGGKLGDFFEVLKDFSDSELKKEKDKELAELNAKLAQTLETEFVGAFSTISDIGSFVIDGIAYVNFYGDGDNRVEVCACDKAEFKSSKYLTRREIYNADEPLTIVRYDEPKTITVAHSDVDKRFGETKVENVLGFAIWERKLKIFMERK